MIDLVKPFGKTVALLNQLGLGAHVPGLPDTFPQAAWLSGSGSFDETDPFAGLRASQDAESFEALRALYALEKEKETYKKALIGRYTLDTLYERERTIVKKMLLAFEKTETAFRKEILILNPLAVFYEGSFIFFVQDGKNLLYKKRDTKYLFIPKSMATGVLRIDDMALGGGLNFLLSVKAYAKPFTMDGLVAGKQAVDVSLLIDKVKKLMLYQSIIIG